ncbi:MAG TPA: sigma-70 family RNA polymerase sigma factor [Ktedonobacteraceae bacterium]|nr:sigma-70 family RNA polymerase sigma factor [Ktedonobacteraceae bacterium]
MTTFFQDAHEQDANYAVSLLAKDQYMRELRWMPLADKEEQASFVEQVKRGLSEQSQPLPDQRLVRLGQQARTRLVESYQPLIVHLARAFARYSTSYDEMDFVNEGSIGLMLLLDRLDAYDAFTGVQFQALALSYIRGEMIAALRDRNGIVRLSKTTVALLKQLGNVEQRLLQDADCEPTYHDIAQTMNIPVEKVLELIEYRRRRLVESLEGLLVEGDAEECLHFVSVFVGQSDETTHVQVHEAIHTAMATALTAKQRTVVQLRYGFDEGPCKLRSHKEVATLLGMAESTIHERDCRAKGRLSNVLASVVACPVASVVAPSKSELRA